MLIIKTSAPHFLVACSRVVMCVGVIFFAAVASQIVGCADRSTSVDVGAENIVVPIPDDFVALKNKSPSFRSFVENGISSNELLLEYFMRKRFMNDVKNNNFKDLMADHKSRNLSITMPRSMYGRNFSEGTFLGYAAATRVTSVEKIAQGESMANEKAEIGAMKSGLVPSLSRGMKWLGVFYDSNDAIGETITNEVRIGQVFRKKVSVDVTVRVKNRMIFLNCNSHVDDDGDVKWAENTCSKWSRDILSLN